MACPHKLWIFFNHTSASGRSSAIKRDVWSFLQGQACGLQPRKNDSKDVWAARKLVTDNALPLQWSAVAARERWQGGEYGERLLLWSSAGSKRTQTVHNLRSKYVSVCLSGRGSCACWRCWRALRRLGFGRTSMQQRTRTAQRTMTCALLVVPQSGWVCCYGPCILRFQIILPADQSTP